MDESDKQNSLGSPRSEYLSSRMLTRLLRPLIRLPIAKRALKRQLALLLLANPYPN